MVTVIPLDEFEGLPRFPDGRIDYSHADKAPVLTCFVTYQDKILLLKRSAKVRTYQSKWCAVAGYLDEAKPLEEKALQELKEELGIQPAWVERLVMGEPYEFQDEQHKKTWRVHPMLAVMKAPIALEIDWEHTDFKWIDPARLSEFDTVPMLAESLKRALAAA